MVIQRKQQQKIIVNRGRVDRPEENKSKGAKLCQTFKDVSSRI